LEGYFEIYPPSGGLSTLTKPLTLNEIFANVFLIPPFISTNTFTEFLYGPNETQHR